MILWLLDSISNETLQQSLKLISARNHKTKLWRISNRRSKRPRSSSLKTISTKKMTTSDWKKIVAWKRRRYRLERAKPKKERLKHLRPLNNWAKLTCLPSLAFHSNRGFQPKTYRSHNLGNQINAQPSKEKVPLSLAGTNRSPLDTTNRSSKAAVIKVEAEGQQRTANEITASG